MLQPWRLLLLVVGIVLPGPQIASADGEARDAAAGRLFWIGESSRPANETAAIVSQEFDGSVNPASFKAADRGKD